MGGLQAAGAGEWVVNMRVKVLEGRESRDEKECARSDCGFALLCAVMVWLPCGLWFTGNR